MSDDVTTPGITGITRARFLRRSAQIGAAAGVSLLGPNVALAASTRAAKSASSKTLSMWIPQGNVSSQKDFRILLANFRKATGITVNVQQIPFAQYDSKSQTALAAGQGPDLLEVNSVTMGAFIIRGYLQPIDAYLTHSSITKDQFYPGIWKHGLYANKMWGLAIDTGTRALFYNKKILAAANVRPPGTHADFADAAIKLTNAKKGVFGYVYAGGQNWLWLYEALGMLTVQDEANIITPDLATCTLDRPPALNSLQLLSHIQLAGAAPKEAVTDSSDQRAAIFAAGRAAMCFFGFWEIPALQQLHMAPSQYGIVNLRGRTGQIGSTTGGWVMSMPAASPNKELAWKFCEFAYRPENLVKLTTLMPATKAANARVLKDAIYAPFKEVLATNARHPIPLNPALPQQATIIMNESQAALIQRKSVLQAAKDATSQIDTTLATIKSL